MPAQDEKTLRPLPPSYTRFPYLPMARMPLPDRGESDHRRPTLDLLLRQAEPSIEAVLRKKLAAAGFVDHETRADLKSETLVRLLERLQNDQATIEELDNRSEARRVG